jgi:hypothetical protein
MKQGLERSEIGYGIAIDSITDLILSLTLFHEMLHFTVPHSK